MATVVITSDLHLGITSPASIQEMVRAIEAEKPDLTVLEVKDAPPFCFRSRQWLSLPHVPGHKYGRT